MADVIKIGDEVEITIRGVVGSGGHQNSTHAVKCGLFTHYVYLGGVFGGMHKDGETNRGVTVKKVEKLEAGQAYVDADGDVLIRTVDGRWVDGFGSHDDDFAIWPLVKLVPEK